MILFEGQLLSSTRYLVRAGQFYMWRPEGSGYAKVLHVGASASCSLDLEVTWLELRM